MDHQALLDTLERLRSLPREAVTVEFESNFDKAEDIGQYISALANSTVLEGHSRMAHKVHNLVQVMRREGLIHREGPKTTAVWKTGPGAALSA